MEERLDVLDENGNLIDQTETKSDVHRISKETYGFNSERSNPVFPTILLVKSYFIRLFLCYNL